MEVEAEAEAEGLQRSVTSFRRSGSSGLVWNDKLLTMENSEPKKENTRSNNREPNTFKTNKDADPMMEPPSPKVSGFGCCAMFGKPKKPKNDKFLRHLHRLHICHSKPKKETTRSNNREPNTFKTNKDVNPMVEPSSPKVSGFGCCAMFGKPKKPKNDKFSKRKS